MLAFLLAATLFDASLSPQEMNKMGLSKLSAKEKRALHHWIEANYTKKAEVAAAVKPIAPNILQENLKNGGYIRLSDNSLWEVKPSDTPITQGWITPVEIKVSSSDDSAYPYNLMNTLTGSSVKAKKVNSIPSDSKK